MRTDSLFYRLFQTLPRLLFDLLGVAPTHAEQYRFQSLELKQTALRLDGLFAPPAERPELPIYFIEVQFQPDPTLYPRLFAELFLYLRQYQPPHPWHAVLIYPTRSLEAGEHLHYRVLLDSAQVSRIYLDEWAREPHTLSQRLIQLLLTPPGQALHEGRELLATLRTAALDSARQGPILDLVETILVYKLPALSRQEIQSMLGLTDADLKKSRFYQEVFAEGKQEGQQKGREEGRQEGRAEGREEGRHAEALELIARQLHRRCGALPPRLHAQLARLSLAQLEALGEALLDFTAPADLQRWLRQHAPAK